MELHTDRLLMRRWTSEDLEPFAVMNTDPEVMRYLLKPLTRAESDGYVGRIEERFEEFGFGLWALELAGTGRFIGYTGMNPMPDGVPGAGGFEVGWRLARDTWGCGYATEAAREAVRFAFDEAGLAELWSLTAVGNARSVAVMRRLGMTHVGDADHPLIAEGHPLRRHAFYHLAAPER